MKLTIFEKFLNKKEISKEDKKRIGNKYIISYEDIVPSYIYITEKYCPQIESFNNKKIFKNLELSDKKTVIEYVGNNIYKDLITGKLYIKDITHDLSISTKYPLSVNKYSIVYESYDMDKFVDDISKTEKNSINLYMDNMEIQILRDTYDYLLNYSEEINNIKSQESTNKIRK